MAKAVARCFVAIAPNRIARARPAKPASSGMISIGRGRSPAPAAFRKWIVAVAANSEKRSVAQGKKPGLPEQHVVGEGEDDHHAHLAEHGDQEAGVAMMDPVVEAPRQRDGNDDKTEMSQRGFMRTAVPVITPA